jgi:hypothetical protein
LVHKTDDRAGFGHTGGGGGMMIGLPQLSCSTEVPSSQRRSAAP